MNSESSAEGTPASARQPPSLPRSGIRTVFVGPNGIRAGWRVLIFAALLAAFDAAILSTLIHATPFGRLWKAAMAGTLTPTFEVISEVAQFGMALLAAAIMCRIEKGNFSSYGIPLRGVFGKNFWSGILGGLAFMSIELLAIHALGGFTFGTFALAGTAIAKYAAIWALGFLLVGFQEEFVYRGYTQFALASGIGFWPAALLLSAAFGGVHLFNAGEDWVGAAQVFVFGLFACFTLRRTGSLWFAIGFHAAGDYAESFIYSVRDSGMVATGHLLRSSFHGPAWLTGGTVGPEGSLLAFAVFALAFLLFSWIYPPKKTASPDRSQSTLPAATP